MQLGLQRLSQGKTGVPARDEQRGAVGWAFLVWLLGGSFGLAVLVFILLKLF
jgi:hypothetical protein